VRDWGKNKMKNGSKHSEVAKNKMRIAKRGLNYQMVGHYVKNATKKLILGEQEKYLKCNLK
jgi:hypothetical protein